MDLRLMETLWGKSTSTLYLVTLITIIVLWLYRNSRNKLMLAPGPRIRYPLLGHLPFLTKDPHIKLNEYRKIYGPVFSITFGRKYAVVLGDFSTIKDFYNAEGGTTRPSQVYNLSQNFRVLMETNGREWYERRRFVMSAVIRGTNRERSTEDIIQEEVSRLLDNLKKRDLTEDVDTTKLLSTVANNVGFSIVCGKSFDEDDPASEFLLNFNRGIQEYIQWVPFGESLEIPKFIYRKIFPKLKIGEDAINQMDDYIKQEIKEHEKKLNPENLRDFIDYALIEMKKPDGYKKIHDYSTIRGECQVLLLGGTDTSRTTMEWFLLLMAKHPEIQEKASQEILDVLGDRRPTWADRTLLPFVDACIMESQRCCTLIPLNPVRVAPRNMKIKGYDVPEGTWIFANPWAVHHDPELWDKPFEFNPNRFLNKEGTQTFEPEFWIPYSLGNRNCIGEKIARMEVFIVLATFMQHYRVLPPSKGISLEGQLSISYCAIHPEVRLEKRMIK